MGLQNIFLLGNSSQNKRTSTKIIVTKNPLNKTIAVLHNLKDKGINAVKNNKKTIAGIAGLTTFFVTSYFAKNAVVWFFSRPSIPYEKNIKLNEKNSLEETSASFFDRFARIIQSNRDTIIMNLIGLSTFIQMGQIRVGNLFNERLFDQKLRFFSMQLAIYGIVCGLLYSYKPI